MKIYFSVDRDGWTNGLQLSIENENGGFRIAGPKYNGRSKNLQRHEITQRDAEEIRRYLDEAFPPVPPIAIF